MAGVELGTGEDDQDEGEAERGTHDQRPDGRIQERAEAEDEEDAEADIDAGHCRADEEAGRMALQEARLRFADGGKLADGFVEHGCSPGFGCRRADPKRTPSTAAGSGGAVSARDESIGCAHKRSAQSHRDRRRCRRGL